MKKILFFIILLIFPSIYFASEATCVYQYEIKLEKSKVSLSLIEPR